MIGCVGHSVSHTPIQVTLKIHQINGMMRLHSLISLLVDALTEVPLVNISFGKKIISVHV